MKEWEEAAKRNKLKRLDWRKIIGKSLNQYVAEKVAKGFEKNEIVKDVFSQAIMAEPRMSEERLFELVKIGVSARIGEMISEKEAYFGKESEKKEIWVVAEEGYKFDQSGGFGLLAFSRKEEAIKFAGDHEEVVFRMVVG